MDTVLKDKSILHNQSDEDELLDDDLDESLLEEDGLDDFDDDFGETKD